MQVEIKSRFTTPQETAKILGVSKKRFKQLLKLVDSGEYSPSKVSSSDKELSNNGVFSKSGFAKSAKQSNHSGLKKPTATRKRRNSGKRLGRGKVSKSSR